MTVSSDSHVGLSLNAVPPGSLIDVETKNRHYHIEWLGGNEMRISGHPQLCPEPVTAELKGSVDRRGHLERGTIAPDHYLLFALGPDTPVTTSKVVSVHVSPPERTH